MKTGFIQAFILRVILYLIVGYPFSPVFAQDAAMQHAIRFQNSSVLQGDSTIDVTYYGLNLTISLHPELLTGIITMNATIAVNSTHSISLEASNTLHIDSVTCNNINTVFSHASDKITIQLPRLFSRGEKITIVSYYQVSHSGTGMGSLTFGSHDGRPSIYSLSEPYGTKDWWICKDTPSDKADSADIILTAPAILTAVSNGKLQSVVINNNGTKTTHWHVSYPIAQYLISVAVSDFSEYTQYFKYSPADSMEVTHYIYPENFSDALPAVVKTIDMLKIFSSLFGPYPFLREKYGHAQFGWGGGMEHQTVSSMGRFTESLISHELAHQWFGDMVTNNNWQDIWLHEGFATYGEALYIENTSGTEAYSRFIDEKMSTAKGAIGSVYVNDISNISNIFNYSRSYAKGCVILHTLRSILGDSIFFTSLKTYLNAPGNRYGTATTENFLSAVNSTSKQNLRYFFDAWIYGSGFPFYEIYWDKIKNNSNYTVNISVYQNTLHGNQLFVMPLKVRIFGNAADTTVTIFNNAVNQSFTVNCSFLPLGIVFDPDNSILKSATVFNADTPVNSPSGFTLYQNYPNPFNSGTTISFYLKAPQTVSIEVFRADGSLVKLIGPAGYTRGLHKFSFDSAGLSSGIYFYKIKTENGSSVKKMILLR
ncbi:MAG: T9SS type A sorting domain-containing protein [Ignavibacteriales bacterium]|nr:T9SS type A sorting domain-containing protein [Ignavibacteriales bacterium]